MQTAPGGSTVTPLRAVVRVRVGWSESRGAAALSRVGGRFLHPRMSELRSLTLLSAAHNRLTMLPTGLGTPTSPPSPRAAEMLPDMRAVGGGGAAGLSALRSLTLAGNPLAPLPPALRERADIQLDVPRA